MPISRWDGLRPEGSHCDLSQTSRRLTEGLSRRWTGPISMITQKIFMTALRVRIMSTWEAGPVSLLTGPLEYTPLTLRMFIREIITRTEEWCWASVGIFPEG